MLVRMIRKNTYVLRILEDIKVCTYHQSVKGQEFFGLLKIIHVIEFYFGRQIHLMLLRQT